METNTNPAASSKWPTLFIKYFGTMTLWAIRTRNVRRVRRGL